MHTQPSSSSSLQQPGQLPFFPGPGPTVMQLASPSSKVPLPGVRAPRPSPTVGDSPSAALQLAFPAVGAGSGWGAARGRDDGALGSSGHGVEQRHLWEPVSSHGASPSLPGRGWGSCGWGAG